MVNMPQFNFSDTKGVEHFIHMNTWFVRPSLFLIFCLMYLLNIGITVKISYFFQKMVQENVKTLRTFYVKNVLFLQLAKLFVVNNIQLIT